MNAPVNQKAESSGVRFPATLRHHSISIRALAVILVTACLVPAFVLAGVFAHQLANEKRAQLEQRTEQVARALADAIDFELRGYKNMLAALATSQNLQSGNLESFYRKARDVSEKLGTHIVVRDPYREVQIINTAVAFNAPLERHGSLIPDEEKAAIRSQSANVSNLIFGPIVKKFLVVVQVPVLKDGVPIYLLSIGLAPGQIRKIFDRVVIGKDIRVVVIDGNGKAITRLDDPDGWVGRQMSRELLADATERHGTWRGLSSERVAIFGAYHRLSEAPWLVGASVLQSTVDAPLIRTITMLGAAGMLLLLVAMYVAYRFGDALSGVVAHLGGAGAALGRTEIVHSFDTPFLEANAASKQLSAASQAIRLAEEQSRFAVDSAGVGTWEWNLANGDLYWSPRYKELIGVSPDTVPEHDLYFQRVFPADRQIVFQNRREYLAGADSYEIEYRIAATDDHPVRWISAKGRVERDVRGRAVRVRGIVIDITARKKVEIEREDLRRRLMSAQEQERLRIARELHDQTGQSLTAIMLEAKRIESLVAEDARGPLQRLQRQMASMGESLHRLALELRPTSIDDLGLAAAVFNHVSDWSQQFGIEVDLHCADNLDEIEREMKMAIYRIVQEALTNVAKHAVGATVVSIIIERSDALLRLTIEDDGRGFDPVPAGTQNVQSKGLGLAGMRERMSLIGGSFEIESSKGVGTTIFVRIPLELSRKTA